MAKNKIVTMEMILAKKGLADKTPDPFYSDFFGGDLIIEQKNPNLIIDIMKGAEKDECYAYSKLIYEHCPAFRTKSLLKDFEVEDPYELPQKVYGSNVFEFYQLGNHILNCYGNLADKVQTIKKK